MKGGVSVRSPYLLFLADAGDRLAAKTAAACVLLCPDRALGQWRLPGCAVDLGLPDLPPREARRRGARSLVLGVAHAGGSLPASWEPALLEAIDAGLDVVGGMHDALSERASLRRAAARRGVRLVDLRGDRGFRCVARGEERPGRRLLTVGTDCSCGKMLTAWRLAEELRRRAVAADFRATGQTGILLAGTGIAVDSVRADFAAGAAEALTPPAHPDHVDVVEGQGSLFHPSFSGVSLALLHGVRPHLLVLCHEPTRKHLRGLPGRPLPSPEEAISVHLTIARLLEPEARFLGVSVDTSALSEGERKTCLRELERRTGLPAGDPERGGAARLLEAWD